MTTKVKNSRPLFFVTTFILILFVTLFHFFYSKRTVKYDMNTLQRYEASLRDSFFSLRYDLRKKMNGIKFSDQITVIGIDDETISAYGKLNESIWATRIYYDGHFKYMQKIFKPACVAVDIMFKSKDGALNAEGALSDDPVKLKLMAQSLITAAEDFDVVPVNILSDLSGVIAEQGELLLRNSLSTLSEPIEGDDPLKVILGYNLKEAGNYYTGGFDFNKSSFYEWSDKDVLGSDPDELSEDLGRIGSLKEISIPVAQVHNISNDFVYLPKADLVSDNFLGLTSLGYLNVRRDTDGTVRRYPLVLATKYYNSVEKKLKTLFLPSLALQSILHAMDCTREDVTVNFGENITIKSDSGNKVIPIDKYGRLLLNFSFKQVDVNYVSFKKVNEFGAILTERGYENLDAQSQGTINKIKEKLAGKIAIIGVTHTANGDTGATSLEDHTTLVNVHATAMNEILLNQHIEPASDVQMYIFIVLIALFLGMAGLTQSIRGLTSLFVFLIVLVVVVNFAGVYWDWKHFPVLFLSFYVLVLYLSLNLFRYVTEEKEKMKIRNMFSTMVSSSVLSYMDENPESFSLSGSKMAATIMFSDVAGFTTISEGLSPEKLVSLLNKYLTPMTDIILESGGYVDKYEGDAIMAEWGVPFPNDKHATLACWAVLDQLKKLDEIRQELYEEFGYKLSVRMGVNTGDVAAGNMGSENRFSYTVMGDAVNLAARLEPTNKIYGTSAMIGEKTYDLAQKDIEVRLLDNVVVVGKTEAIRVYELISKKGEWSQEQKQVTEHYEKGLELHSKRLWDEAIAEFEAALKVNSEDFASQVLIKRIEGYKVEDPPESWKGEYVRTSKD